MSCGNCGTTKANGKPAGCQSNGNCSSGGCNRMNVFNWLAEMPLSDLGKPYHIVEVSFNNGSRKDYFKNIHYIALDKGSFVTVEGTGGIDVGQVNLTGELVKIQLKKHNIKEDNLDIKKILRISTEHDLQLFREAKKREIEVLIQSRSIARTLNLDMKIAETEVQADGKKVTVFYTAENRVDFRELVKVYATEFKAKIEMKQIGSRQESAKVGGIGSCGRELCCSSWLSDFKTVNTTAARYQNLSINQAKLSGQCGRLKCCLNYELDTYMDALKSFPEHAEVIEIISGRAFLQKKDIFRNLMWYSFPGSTRQYPLTIDRVIEILEMNKKGEKPEELEAIEIQATQQRNVSKQIDMGFVNDVGQISLNALNRSKRKKKAQPNREVSDARSKQVQNPANKKRVTRSSENKERVGTISDRNTINPKKTDQPNAQKGQELEQRGQEKNRKSRKKMGNPSQRSQSTGQKNLNQPSES